ncbi:MAG: hypothetical protein ACI38Y_00020, partial [Candidatus Methanomethylophilaceae archaeon]
MMSMKDAGFYRNLSTMKGRECGFVPLEWNGKPDQANIDYYLFWRDCLKKGEYVKADSGYLRMLASEMEYTDIDNETAETILDTILDKPCRSTDRGTLLFDLDYRLSHGCRISHVNFYDLFSRDAAIADSIRRLPEPIPEVVLSYMTHISDDETTDGFRERFSTALACIMDKMETDGHGFWDVFGNGPTSTGFELYEGMDFPRGRRSVIVEYDRAANRQVMREFLNGLCDFLLDIGKGKEPRDYMFSDIVKGSLDGTIVPEKRERALLNVRPIGGESRNGCGTIINCVNPYLLRNTDRRKIEKAMSAGPDDECRYVQSADREGKGYMNSEGKLRYYRYWKRMMESGRYIDSDSGYLWMYINETIIRSEKPKTVIDTLSEILDHYCDMSGLTERTIADTMIAHDIRKGVMVDCRTTDLFPVLLDRAIDDGNRMFSLRSVIRMTPMDWTDVLELTDDHANLLCGCMESASHRNGSWTVHEYFGMKEREEPYLPYQELSKDLRMKPVDDRTYSFSIDDVMESASELVHNVIIAMLIEKGLDHGRMEKCYLNPDYTKVISKRMGKPVKKRSPITREGFLKRMNKELYLDAEMTPWIPCPMEYGDYNIMDDRQYQYYLYWRGCLRRGEWVDSDDGYIRLRMSEMACSDEDPEEVMEQLHLIADNHGEEEDFKFLSDYAVVKGIDIGAICDYGNRCLDASVTDMFSHPPGRFSAGDIERLADLFGYDRVDDPEDIVDEFNSIVGTVSKIMVEKTGFDIVENLGGPRRVVDITVFEDSPVYDGDRRFHIIYREVGDTDLESFIATVLYAADIGMSREGDLEDWVYEMIEEAIRNPLDTIPVPKDRRGNTIRISSEEYERMSGDLSALLKGRNMRLNLDRGAVDSAQRDLEDVTGMMSVEYDGDEDAGSSEDIQSDMEFDGWDGLMMALDHRERDHLRALCT